MIVIDSSAWIEYLRGSDHPVCGAIKELLLANAPIATTDVIVMEVLAGAHGAVEAYDLRARLVSLELLVLEGLGDFERAADLFRRCRLAGETISNLADCLIAVPAIRAQAEVLHKDRDFDSIARHSDLRVYPVS